MASVQAYDAFTRHTDREQSVIDEGELIAGHYRLLEPIGSGSMGVVWRARDERLERVVAIKQLLLQPGLTDKEKQDARRRALREARIAARLQHPNAIVVFDVAEHDGDPWLVMEYLPSRSLAAELAERGSLPVAEVAALGSQIASALAAAHACGIVHRDIKPGNVLIGEGGVAKLTDFGIARAVGDITVTQTGLFAGTPAYLAPEVARGHDPTPASDVFSLGATLYDAVEGGPPFPERQNQLALLRLVAEGAVQPPRQAGALTALLMKLLRSEPEDRPSMAQASELLTQLAGSSIPNRPFVTASSTRPDLRPPNSRNLSETARKAPPPTSTALPATAIAGRKRLLLIAATVLVVVLVGAGIVVASLSSNGPRNSTADGARSSTSQGQHVSPTTTPGGSPDGSVGLIEYTPAGQLVIDFYSNPAGSWSALTPNAQRYFGSEQAFQQYWNGYSSVSGSKAYGVTRNQDGSVNVPVTVSYTVGDASQATRMQVRVVQQNGQLYVDSDPRIPR